MRWGHQLLVPCEKWASAGSGKPQKERAGEKWLRVHPLGFVLAIWLTVPSLAFSLTTSHHKHTSPEPFHLTVFFILLFLLWIKVFFVNQFICFLYALMSSGIRVTFLSRHPGVHTRFALTLSNTFFFTTHIHLFANIANFSHLHESSVY